jgi:CRISPR-associated protein Csd2
MLDQMKNHPSEILDRRCELVYLFDVAQGNPNGDPDGDNAPRVDIETGHGLVTDVCLKRKIRNYIGLTKDYAPPYDIYVKERGILANEQKKAYLDLGVTEGTDRPNMAARAWMCKNYFDVRTFGAVMTMGQAPLEDAEEGKGNPEGKKAQADKKARHWNCGQVRGPVQLSFSRSTDPIFSVSHTITRVALTNFDDTRREAAEGDTGDEKAATGQMGRKHTVAYGLYRAHIFLSPFLAKDTLFSNADFVLLVDALRQMFEFDHSASRGEMNARALYAFMHTSALGNAPSHKLFDLVTVAAEPEARSFRAERISAPADGSEPSPGVHCHKLL